MVDFALHCIGSNLQLIILDLPDKVFYPTVAAVYGNTEISMVYLGPPLDG